MRIRSILAIAGALILALSGAQAQQFPPGYIQGNAGASAAPPRAIAPSAWFDRWCGSTSGFIAYRAAGAWGCAAPGATSGVQPYDADLAAFASATTAADKLWYWTGSSTGALTDFTSYGRSLVAVANEAEFKSLVNLEPGVDVQAYDGTLAALAALDSTAGILTQTGADTFARRTLTAPAAGLSITNANGVAGNPTFALANDLAAVEGLSSTGCVARTGADTWSTRAITGTANEISVANGNCVAGNPTLTLPSSLTFTGKTVTGGTFAGVTLSGVADNQGVIKNTAVLTPSQITSDQNNYNPSSAICASASTLVLSSDASRDVTGLGGGVAGCSLKVINAGSNNIVFKDADTDSSANNRFAMGADVTLGPNQTAEFLYHAGTVNRWRYVGVPGTGGGGGGVSSIARGDRGLDLAPNPITSTGTIRATFARSFLLGGL